MLDESKRPTAEVLQALPIFPLPNVVFMPGMVLPLNVFEPRYLELVDHVRDSGCLHIGVPLLEPRSGSESSPPTFHRVFGIGRLVHHKLLEDGRRFIRLEGVCRVRQLRELHQEHQFRRCAVEVLPESSPEREDLLEVLKAQVERLGVAFSDDDQQMIASILRIEDPRALTYVLCALVPNIEPTIGGDASGAYGAIRPDLALQQRCMESESCDERIEILLARAGAIIRRLTEMGRFSMSAFN